MVGVKKFISATAPERLGIEVPAFVRMDTHYHLLLQTPEPNRRQALHRLEVSCGTRWNGAHRLSGHVFQGRFPAKLIGGVQRRKSNLSVPRFNEGDR